MTKCFFCGMSESSSEYRHVEEMRLHVGGIGSENWYRKKG